jgi:hypothetical protein
MNTPIIITKNPNGDTRTAPKNISFEQFQVANNMHRTDVKAVMKYLANLVYIAGLEHDYTKKSEEELFYKNFLSTINNGTNFVEDDWYQFHINTERHHLFSRCPEDVNLIDVLEMIADCTCAGLARSGKVSDLKIDSDILERAVQNTVKLITDKIDLVD